MDAPPPASTEAIAALAPTGTLRAGINLSNFLLVSRVDDDGRPHGVSPDIATALADALGVGIELVTFANPGEVADAAVDDVWDIGNIGAAPARAVHIDFSAPYALIECAYLVRGDSPLRTIADVDQPGTTISVKARAAYHLWLEDNLQHADLVTSPSIDDSFDRFVADELDVLAGLKARLLSDLEQLDGARLLDGVFSRVQQAIGTPKTRPDAGHRYLESFVAWATTSGFVAERIDHHSIVGLASAHQEQG